MTNEVAIPQCFVEVYPFEGGPLSIVGGQIKSCTVDKNIRADKGTFEIVLAPGGPLGVSAGPTWTQILTPMSAVYIGMARGSRRQVVMVGVIRTVHERTVWTPQGAQRLTTVSGEDFCYFFNTFNWIALTFLGTTAAAAAGAAIGNAEAGLPAILSGSLLQGTPAQVAATWFNQIMGGAKGILAQTAVAYRNGTTVPFPSAMATLFQEYPGFIIPFGDYFIAAEGTWMAKFRDILPFPWYEFFVITAPLGFYPGDAGGYPFRVAGVGDTFPAAPTLVGRVNPLPRIPVTISGSSASFGAIDTTAWNALPLFQPDVSLIDSDLSFDESEIRNFYLLNPVWFRRMFGDSNSSIAPFIFSFIGCSDAASIHRYGYRPEYAATHWLYDGTAGQAQNPAIDVNTLVADLTAKLFSYYHPTPLMARSRAMYPLRPDIMPGCRFRYPPIKGQPDWDFYIEGVSHQFVFGRDSTTALIMTRGLPSSVYADTSKSGVLTQLHLGNVQRLNGQYQVGLPPGSAPGLTSFSMQQADIMQTIGNIAQVYITPQGH